MYEYVQKVKGAGEQSQYSQLNLGLGKFCEELQRHKVSNKRKLTKQ